MAGDAQRHWLPSVARRSKSTWRGSGIFTFEPWPGNNSAGSQESPRCTVLCQVNTRERHHLSSGEFWPWFNNSHIYWQQLGERPEPCKSIWCDDPCMPRSSFRDYDIRFRSRLEIRPKSKDLSEHSGSRSHIGWRRRRPRKLHQPVPHRNLYSKTCLPRINGNVNGPCGGCEKSLWFIGGREPVSIREEINDQREERTADPESQPDTLGSDGSDACRQSDKMWCEVAGQHENLA